jgi:fumarylacetoacetate (FAA) hydrolase
MKLASYNDGSRDGQLVVVSRDLTQAQYATQVTGRLQQVLDDWNFLSPQLQDIYDTLNSGRARHAFAFDAGQCLAPLPRVYQWVQADALQAGAVQAGAFAAMRRCAGDGLLRPGTAVNAGADVAGLNVAPGLAVITGDVPQACPPDRALDGVRLVVLVNELRWHVAGDTAAPALADGWQDCRASAFGPVAVTPDEPGVAWAGGRAHLALHCSVNGRAPGRLSSDAETSWQFGQRIAQLCRYRAACAGTVVGVVQASGELLAPGDRLRIEALGRDGQSIFGAIEQEVTGSLRSLDEE